MKQIIALLLSAAIGLSGNNTPAQSALSVKSAQAAQSDTAAQSTLSTSPAQSAQSTQSTPTLSLHLTSHIELHNESNQAISTRGYYLTDDLSNLYQYQIPTMIIRPDSQIEFGTNKRNTPNFEFNPDNTVYLIDANGEIAANSDGLIVFMVDARYFAPTPVKDAIRVEIDPKLRLIRYYSNVDIPLNTATNMEFRVYGTGWYIHLDFATPLLQNGSKPSEITFIDWSNSNNGFMFHIYDNLVQAGCLLASQTFNVDNDFGDINDINNIQPEIRFNYPPGTEGFFPNVFLPPWL